jgi:divalent metal cation (Fe/Co/Zn/Cd) transporter
MHFGPHEVLLNMEVRFRFRLSAAEVAAAVERLEKRIRTRHPDVKRIFIEAQSLTPDRRPGCP